VSDLEEIVDSPAEPPEPAVAIQRPEIVADDAVPAEPDASDEDAVVADDDEEAPADGDAPADEDTPAGDEPSPQVPMPPTSDPFADDEPTR
jgi:hypothetical protein